MTYASLLGSALAYGLFFWFASSGDLTSFTSLTFLTPVFALLCGVALLGRAAAAAVGWGASGSPECGADQPPRQPLASRG